MENGRLNELLFFSTCETTQLNAGLLMRCYMYMCMHMHM